MKARPRFALAGAGLCGLLALTACSSDAAPPVVPSPDCPTGGSLAIINGRGNSPSVTAGTLKPMLEAAAKGGASVTLIDAGGTPAIADTFTFTSDASNDEAKKKDLREQAGRLSAALGTTVPQSPEANPLKALDLAGRTLKSEQAAAGGTGGTIVLADSGLQTVAPLNYTVPGLVSAVPDEVVNKLKAADLLPDLTGLTVVLVGIGDTSPPQQGASTSVRNDLTEQWSAIATAAGACVSAAETPVGGTAPAGAPAVTVVDLPQPQNISLPAAGADLKLDSNVVAFHVNSADLKDPDAARATLSSISESLKSQKQDITLTGTTATDGTVDYRRDLAKQRAEAVKSVLVELGVSADSIHTVGAGTDSKWYVNDLDAEGQLVPELAQQNRAVYLTLGKPS